MKTLHWRQSESGPVLIGCSIHVSQLFPDLAYSDFAPVAKKLAAYIRYRLGGATCRGGLVYLPSMPIKVFADALLTIGIPWSTFRLTTDWILETKKTPPLDISAGD